MRNCSPAGNLGVKAIKGVFSSFIPRFKILAFHSVGESNSYSFEVAPDMFQKQMCFLAENGYHVIPLEEAFRSILKNKIHEKTIVITFDDGFDTLIKFAFPVLRQFGFPATVFLPVTYIGGIDLFSHSEYGSDRVLMNWASIENSTNDGISFGSHTMSHPDLVVVDGKTLHYELYESKTILKERLGIDFHALAYPFGRFDDRVKNATRQTGYDCALSFCNVLSNTKNTDLYELKREKIDNSTSLKDFTHIINTRYDFSRGVKTLIRNVSKNNQYKSNCN